MNDTELVKKGLDVRIKRLGAEMLCYEAQGDYLRALERNQRKIELLFWLTKIINGQVDIVVKGGKLQ